MLAKDWCASWTLSSSSPTTLYKAVKVTIIKVYAANFVSWTNFVSFANFVSLIFCVFID